MCPFIEGTDSVSAFARRKASKKSFVEAIPLEEASIPETNDEIKIFEPPKKKRRRDKPSKPSKSVPTPPLEHPDVQNDSGDVSDKAFEDSGDSEIEGDSEDEMYAVILWDRPIRLLIMLCSLDSDGETLLKVPPQKLSTISPIKSIILSDTDSTWSIRLHQKDVWSNRILRGRTGSENM